MNPQTANQLAMYQTQMVNGLTVAPASTIVPNVGMSMHNIGNQNDYHSNNNENFGSTVFAPSVPTVFTPLGAASQSNYSGNPVNTGTAASFLQIPNANNNSNFARQNAYNNATEVTITAPSGVTFSDRETRIQSNNNNNNVGVCSSPVAPIPLSPNKGPPMPSDMILRSPAALSEKLSSSISRMMKLRKSIDTKTKALLQPERRELKKLEDEVKVIMTAANMNSVSIPTFGITIKRNPRPPVSTVRTEDVKQILRMFYGQDSGDPDKIVQLLKDKKIQDHATRMDTLIGLKKYHQTNVLSFELDSKAQDILRTTKQRQQKATVDYLRQPANSEAAMLGPKPLRPTRNTFPLRSLYTKYQRLKRANVGGTLSTGSDDVGNDE